MEVDGRLLLDSAQTPTDNFPTIASTGCSVGTKQDLVLYNTQEILLVEARCSRIVTDS